MSRPLGSKNKTTVIEQTEGKVERPYVAITPQPTRYDSILAIRNLRNGPFKGLWELVKLNSDMSVEKVLTDANSRGMVITMMNREILKIVVQG